MPDALAVMAGSLGSAAPFLSGDSSRTFYTKAQGSKRPRREVPDILMARSRADFRFTLLMIAVTAQPRFKGRRNKCQFLKGEVTKNLWLNLTLTIL